jgi:hypothetical protein
MHFTPTVAMRPGGGSLGNRHGTTGFCLEGGCGSTSEKLNLSEPRRLLRVRKTGSYERDTDPEIGLQAR